MAKTMTKPDLSTYGDDELNALEEAETSRGTTRRREWPFVLLFVLLMAAAFFGAAQFDVAKFLGQVSGTN